MQVTDDAPGRNPIFDHPFNLLALCAMFLHEEQCVFAKEAAFRVVNLSIHPLFWIGFTQLAPC